MGFLDRFKKKKENVSNQRVEEQSNTGVIPVLSVLSDGRLNAEFYNGETNEFYDTTKLTVDVNSPFALGGKVLYNCVVAWDGENDARFGTESTKENSKIAGNRKDYKGVWLDLDLVKLQTDPEYCEVLMNKLLLRSRVCQIIEDGLKEEPERPCGKYIGGVVKQEGKYKKNFDPFVGREAHYSSFMTDRREKLRQKEIERKNAQIKANEEKIAALQAENASLSEIE